MDDNVRLEALADYIADRVVLRFSKDEVKSSIPFRTGQGTVMLIWNLFIGLAQGGGFFLILYLLGAFKHAR